MCCIWSFYHLKKTYKISVHIGHTAEEDLGHRENKTPFFSYFFKLPIWDWIWNFMINVSTKSKLKSKGEQVVCPITIKQSSSSSSCPDPLQAAPAWPRPCWPSYTASPRLESSGLLIHPESPWLCISGWESCPAPSTTTWQTDRQTDSVQLRQPLWWSWSAATQTHPDLGSRAAESPLFSPPRGRQSTRVGGAAEVSVKNSSQTQSSSAEAKSSELRTVQSVSQSDAFNVGIKWGQSYQVCLFKC